MVPRDPSSSQTPIYSESNSYCRQLLRQGRGFPMYIPGPHKNLPVAYRKTGIAIGDVGRITPEGSFDFFFNIYLPASDPINTYIPGDFVPLSPYNPIDVTDFDFDPGNFVSTPSTYAIDGGFSEPIPGGEFVFNCRGPDGAVLALPHGAHLEKLENLENMRRYAAKHAESWYQYVNGARGRGLVNGSLYLITACEKSKSWGMASFHDVPHENEFQISFSPTADEDDGYRYRWHGTRCRYKQADPPLVEGTPVNQTTFIHAFAISLGEGLWGKLFGGVHVSQLADSSALGGASPGGFVPYGPQSSSTWFLGFFSGGSATGANDDTDRSLVQENTTISAVSPIPVVCRVDNLLEQPYQLLLP
ncbi:hypothetical protein C8F04DRAFT_975264 [Mycena alexandri]|uniref:Uncharacterized protein n=1 Tax=Mycena alexandri TaxID=1745969 RepID=A0AAD6WSZ0_9AGAR|nr:hypothetical protein C8F04DRAFT_975264 [Mycena alexandri]